MFIGLSALSFSYRCGLIGRGTVRAVSHPLGVEDIITLATRAGLQSIEFPLGILPDLSPNRLSTLRERCNRCGLTPVADSEIVDIDLLKAHIPAAAMLGARVLRVLISPVLEGYRRPFTDNWPAHLADVTARLRAVIDLAAEHNIVLAVENHQDATSADLAAICTAVDSPFIGVCFDAVNCLVVGETPYAAFERLGPLIRNVHLADYETYPTTQGWRLVRCALGEGDLDIRRLFGLIEQYAPDVACQIELVSHSARHVRILDDDWWQGYPPCDVREVLPVLRLFAQTMRLRDDDWRTPWERGSGEEQISLYEDQQYATSIAYLRTIGVLPRF
ncbi:sugar phosphate isomerase/epimerase family protein [Chloroflexus aggregans]|uniref:Xylose isomerase domain protein TIM barrel n=1 Tax=Chloroflexus aggregans (strain MD-66 / DSM 9485) TaxID=326427 RepID=B8G7H9_CHLAD|nr:sugar phosphate isomerase/epimerase family protein [Chloroflexus aggregans]ACL26014.1 Xylose isomerase domain protein TIM barrel [Chloroflexus aggregans DSM 9485]